MKKSLRQLSRWLVQRLTNPELKALAARVQRLESALAQAQARNQELTAQLNQQREKTRELYARTKDYAARLNAGIVAARQEK